MISAMEQKFAGVCGVLLVGVMAGSAQAEVISFNYSNGDSDIPTSDSVAGAFPATNWNNGVAENGGNGTISNLTDSAGNVTTLDATFSDGADFLGYFSFGEEGQDQDGTYNRNLIRGYSNAGGAEGGNLTLEDVPYGLYDVYVYFNSDTEGREGSVTDGSSEFFFSATGGPSISGPNAILTPAVDVVDDEVDEPANYAVFSGLTGDTQDFNVTIPSFGGIAGFQVVEIPEPASLALVGLGGLCLVARRRRRA